MRHTLLASLLLLFSQMSAYGQNLDISMQAWYWDYFQNGNFGNWINNLNGKAAELQQAGFKHIWLPPLSRSSNADNFSNGYNPKDLYDFGEFGPACAWGTRAQLNTLISNYNAHGLNVVSDMIYNHRDGGSLEKNEAVRYFITTQSNTVVYPSDRFVYVLPLGSANPGNNGAGDYYLKIKSKTNGYSGNKYKFYAKTSLTTYQGQVNETEPNGGADCGGNPPYPSQAYTLGQDLICNLGADVNGCHVDEIKITLAAGNFNATDDTLFVYLTNYQSGYSDHYIYGLWSAPRNQNIVDELECFTYTDYTNMASGAGEMDYNGFRPNDETSNAGGVTETLGCDWNCPLFFYDYDQSQPMSETVLNEWTKWQIDEVGVKGLRMDAVKHFDPAFVGQMMDYLDGQNALPEFAVGEFFDYNPGTLNNWVEAVDDAMVQDEVKVRTFDFALRDALKKSCDQINYDVRNIFTSGMVDAAGADPFKVVTFVDNHDIRHEGNYINYDARLAYAYILTNNQVGAPCVFYPDYFGGSVGGAPNIMLKSRIDRLIEVHQDYIYQSEEAEYLSKNGGGYYQYFKPRGNSTYGYPHTTLVYQLQPPPGSDKNVIVAINFAGDTMKMYQEIFQDWGIDTTSVFTDMLGYALNGTYHEITNNFTDPEIYIELPPRSYTVYVQGINTPLPVELLDFQAIAEKDRVLLRWSSASERNFSRYEVERSVGNETRFETISTVSGKNAVSTADYLHYDEQPVFNQPLYYRLRMVDADGKIEHSPVRTATLARRTLEAYLAPNPGSAVSVYLKVEAAQDFRIRITDALGRVAYEQEHFAETGESAWPLPTAQLPNGTYQVTVQGEREVLAMSLIKSQ